MRLTTDNPSGLFQGLDNCFYIKDGKVMVRGGAEALGCDDNSLDEAFGEMLFDGPTTKTGILGLIYEMAKSLGKLRERLKEYEDTGASPGEMHQVIAMKKHG